MSQYDASKTVRDLHQSIEAEVDSLMKTEGKSSLEAWMEATTKETAALQVYAEAMSKLSQCWEGEQEGTARGTPPAPDVAVKDERLQIVSNVLKDFYQPGSFRGRPTVCRRMRNEFREEKRRYFKQQHAALPDSEAGELVNRFNCQSAAEVGSIVRVLDVGSCNGNLRRVEAILPWTSFVHVDLSPSRTSPFVLNGDWLQVKVQLQDEDKAAGGASHSDESLKKKHAELETVWTSLKGKDLKPPEDSAVAVAHVPFPLVLPQGLCHVVLMCFMLSFLPRPELRFRACKTAYELLPTKGALLVIDARRGAHRTKWPQRWAAALGKLLPGFGATEPYCEIGKSCGVLLLVKTSAGSPLSEGPESLVNDLTFAE
jgi:hypothetical protein